MFNSEQNDKVVIKFHIKDAGAILLRIHRANGR